MKPSFFALGTFVSVLATSLVVSAIAPPPGPSPSPTPPPPPKCDPRTFNVTVRDYPKKLTFTTDRRGEADGDFEVSCKSLASALGEDGVRIKSGKIRVSCEESMGGTYASWDTPRVECETETAKTVCQPGVSVGVSKNELQKAYGNDWDNIRGDLIAIPPGDVGQSNIARVSMACRSFYESDNSPAELMNQGFYQTSFLRSCKEETTGLCYLDPYGAVKRSSYSGNDYEFETDGMMKPLADSAGKVVKQSVLYVWNKSSSNNTLPDGAIKFMTRTRFGWNWPASYEPRTAQPVSEKDVQGVAEEATSCELRVSGVIGGYQNTEPKSAIVDNGMLVFTVNLKGGTGVGLIPPKVTYSGGPNALTGVWENPPAKSTAVVTANVVTGVSKSRFSCQLKVDTRGATSTVRLRRFGDCGYFDALRTHFFHDASQRGKQMGPYDKPVYIPGFKAKYGTKAPEVPYAGVMNAAATIDGNIIVSPTGKVAIPTLDKRRYTRAVIVAKRFGNGSQVEQPLFSGEMDLNDYSLTRMDQVDPTLKLSDDENVVFQAYIAASQVTADFKRDLRGTKDGAPFENFYPGTTKDLPFDKVIPFTNESCVPLFQAKPPLREDIKNPDQILTSVTQCLYSRPFTVGDIRNGRVDLTLMHLVPLHADHQFPKELLKASSQPACVARNTTNQTECWDMKASNMGVAANENPYEAHTACRTTTTTYINETATSRTQICDPPTGNGGWGGGSCRTKETTTTARVPITTTTYKASCPVLEKASECKANLAIRFSGYNQMMLAGLMCAAKNNRSGEQVAPTLTGQGIIPYTLDLGGSDPKVSKNYSEATGPGSKNKSYDNDKGVGCIPCRFASDALKINANLSQDTVALPLDQDQTAARKPIFSFKKMKAPAECVRNVTFEVRYFGSAECNGVNAPAGHFCRSSNLGGQNCGAKEHGGGNVAGSYTIPICPNSGFEYDNVSASWSPLVIDVAGNGIEISRHSSYAVNFDIRGDGKVRRVDWPINASDVALLVMPNKNGKVESGKELFGEYMAKDGFAALAKFDSNKDKKIDRFDKDYDKLRLWFDRNRDGVYDQGEGEMLADHGVDTIYLQHRKALTHGTDGRTLYSVYYNGKQKQFQNIADYYFNEYPAEEPKK